MLHGICISDLQPNAASFHRDGLVKTLKTKLIERKDREQIEQQRAEMQQVADHFRLQVVQLRSEFEKKKAQLTGE